jgi:hypothetical protein
MIGVLGKMFNIGHKNVIKYDLLWNKNKRVVIEDYTLDLKRAQPHGGSSQIKISATLEHLQETAKYYGRIF